MPLKADQARHSGRECIETCRTLALQGSTSERDEVREAILPNSQELFDGAGRRNHFRSFKRGARVLDQLSTAMELGVYLGRRRCSTAMLASLRENPYFAAPTQDLLKTENQRASAPSIAHRERLGEWGPFATENGWCHGLTHHRGVCSVVPTLARRRPT